MKNRRLVRVAFGTLLLSAVLVFTACGNEQKERYKEAEQDLVQGHYEAALEGFEQAVANDIYVEEAWRGEGIALLKLNRYEEAIEAFETALAQEKGGKNFQRDVWLYKAAAEHKGGNLEQALESCRQAESLGADAECYLLMGRLQLELDQYEDAQLSFQNAIEKDDSYDIYVDVYQSYEQKDMAADGEDYLKQALEQEGKSKEDHYQRGRIYFFMGDNESARKELTLSVDEEYAKAMLFLGKVYLSENDVENARAMYQKYMGLDENIAKGYNGLALCDMLENNYDGALANIQKGLEIAETEDVQELMYNEIVVYEKTMDFQTAKSKMETYIELYPDDAQAQKEYEFLQYR